MRFKNAVHAHDGDEKEKVAAVILHCPRPSSVPISSCFTCKAKRRLTRTLKSCACNKAHFCNKQCQIGGWPKHMVVCMRARKRKNWKKDYSKDKMLVGELLSVSMRGGGVEGVLRTILKYV